MLKEARQISQCALGQMQKSSQGFFFCYENEQMLPILAQNG
jgi:hypothetical protein